MGSDIKPLSQNTPRRVAYREKMRGLILPYLEAHPEQSYREAGLALGLNPQVVQWWAAKSGIIRRSGSKAIGTKHEAYILRAIMKLPEVTYERIADVFGVSIGTVASVATGAGFHRPRGSKRGSSLPKEEIVNALYQALPKASTKEAIQRVAERFGVHRMTVYKIARESGVYSVIPVTRKPTKRGEVIIDLLRNNPELSYQQIAERAGTHVVTVGYWAKKLSIPHRRVRAKASSA
jgi:DNA-binding CsgD family transcriptional regulator